MPIVFAFTRDLTLVRRAIAGDARIWDASSDDGAPARESWSPRADAAISYVTARARGQLIALYTFIPVNAVTWEIHATRVFGRETAEALAGVTRWFAAQTGARRIVAAIPATNRAAIRCALRAGFGEYGRDPASWLKRGELIGRILVGISL